MLDVMVKIAITNGPNPKAIAREIAESIKSHPRVKSVELTSQKAHHGRRPSLQTKLVARALLDLELELRRSNSGPLFGMAIAWEAGLKDSIVYRILNRFTQDGFLIKGDPVIGQDGPPLKPLTITENGREYFSSLTGEDMRQYPQRRKASRSRAIRNWAHEQGIKLSPRGPIPVRVKEAYDRAKNAAKNDQKPQPGETAKD